VFSLSPPVPNLNFDLEGVVGGCDGGIGREGEVEGVLSTIGGAVLELGPEGGRCARMLGFAAEDDVAECGEFGSARVISSALV
jgi:hypothetical protein